MASRKCGCPSHQDAEHSGPLFDVRHKKVKAATVKHLLSGTKCNFLCKTCIDTFEKDHNLSVPSSSKKARLSYGAQVLELLHQSDISAEDLKEIAYCIGQKITNDVQKDINTINRQFKERVTLKGFNVNEWLHSRNEVLVQFLKGATNMEKERTPKKSTLLTSAVDTIYKAKDVNYVSPLHFSANLVNYNITGSKLVCNIFSQMAAGGNYKTILKWLNEQSSSNMPAPPTRDVITYFDNNQVLMRNWRVRADAKMFVSVITSVMNIIPSPHTNLQYDQALSPSSWLYKPTLSTADIVAGMMAKLAYYNEIFNKYRDTFLTYRIKYIRSKQTQQGATITDNIDNNTFSMDTPDELQGLDDSVVSCHPQQPPKISMAEPVMVNPCSYAAVREVMTDISTTSNQDGRKWNVIGCDGLPYVLASRLIDNDRNLQNIVMSPGQGHFEINMTRAMFKLLWDPILKDVADLLNFKSPKAKEACRKAYDHHKAWQMLTILFFGTCDELLTTYIRDSMTSGTNPSSTNFYQYLHNCRNKNYRFMAEIIFTYLFALMIFRVGVRKNHQDVLLAGRLKFSPLFYCLNMPFYQQIDFRDLRIRTLLPDQLQSFWRATESFSVSGNAEKGEGGDFVLEGRNKATKQWIPMGLPNELRWKRSIKNIDLLEEVGII